jgi:hypothetical protein
MLAAAQQAEQLLGPALGISADQILQALGHVASRSLTSGSSSGLVPFIDLINHGSEAMGPMLQLDDNDKLVMTVLPIRNVSCCRNGCLHLLLVPAAGLSCLSPV